jgi:integrase
MKVLLTDKFCQAIKSSEARTDYYDSKTSGLVLRVTPTGVKTFTLLYVAPGGERARLNLGHYPHLPLARARTLALEHLSLLEEGRDPRHGGGGVRTVADLVADYVRKRIHTLRTVKAIERRLAKNVVPIIGGMPIEQVHRRDINRVLDAIIDRDATIEARRVFEDTRAMFRWAVERGNLDHSPTDGMRAPAVSKARERVLSDAELHALWEGLPKALPRSKNVQHIIRLCLLTGQRVGEVAGMHRAELDLEAGIWTIPSSRSKNKRAHTVPLSGAAMKVITSVLDGDYLFPGEHGVGALPVHTAGCAIRRAQGRFGIAQWTAHDLRRTAVTNMARLGVSPIVLGHVINHISVTKAGVTLSVYSQYDYAKEKREALDLWAAHLDAIVQGGAKVLPMRRA